VFFLPLLSPYQALLYAVSLMPVLSVRFPLYLHFGHDITFARSLLICTFFKAMLLFYSHLLSVFVQMGFYLLCNVSPASCHWCVGVSNGCMHLYAMTPAQLRPWLRLQVLHLLCFLSIMEAPTGHTSICLCKWFGVDAPKPRTLVKVGGCFYVRS
jgi:hypothetical protein